MATPPVPSKSDRKPMTEQERVRKAAEDEKKSEKAETTATSMGEGKPDPIGFIREKFGFKKGGKVGSASKRADGIASKGKTKGRFV